MPTPNQKARWNEIHAARELAKYSQTPTDFAKEVIKLFPANAKVLELGCGLGNDAAFFAEHRNKVLATDFSEVAINENIKNYIHRSNLAFQTIDMSLPFPFKSGRFDVVYARLSLHYFTDQITQQIFSEINRVLTSNGLLCFMCKSTSDPLYGKGEQIEKDMFVFNGHVRHFFSREYMEQCLVDFRIKSLEEDQKELYGHRSAFIKAIANKTS